MRTLLVALVAANLLFFVFTRGWLDGIGGINSLGDREPGRLALQVRPESIRLLPMPAASGASDRATSPVSTSPTLSSASAPAR